MLLVLLLLFCLLNLFENILSPFLPLPIYLSNKRDAMLNLNLKIHLVDLARLISSLWLFIQTCIYSYGCYCYCCCCLLACLLHIIWTTKMRKTSRFDDTAWIPSQPIWVSSYNPTQVTQNLISENFTSNIFFQITFWIDYTKLLNLSWTKISSP